MIIHVVKPGESLYSISRLYNVSFNKIAADNELENPSRLVIGQTLNIPSSTTKLGTIGVNGYTFPSISSSALQKTLPYLTYLSIFSHSVKADGTLIAINDNFLISAARQAKVAPLLVITNLLPGGGFSSDLAHAILSSERLSITLLNNVLQTLKTKKYYGLDIDFEYIYAYDRELYNNFLRKAVEKLKPLGFFVTTSLAPKLSADQKGLLYEAHDYPVHGQLASQVILMTYEWGYTAGPPMAVAPLNEVRKVLDYAVTAIPRNKILMGIPNYGYDWKLPYKPGTRATTVSNVGAVNIAATWGAEIQYDGASQAPFFNYYDDNRKQHVVWFEDARSIRAKLQLVKNLRISGISYWTIGRYFPQNWLVLNSLYNIEKVL